MQNHLEKEIFKILLIKFGGLNRNYLLCTVKTDKAVV